MLSILQLQKIMLISLFISMFTTFSICQEIDQNKTVYGPIKPADDMFQAYAIALSDDNMKAFVLSHDELSVFDVSTPSHMTVEHYGIMSYDEFIDYKKDAIKITGENAYNQLANSSLNPYTRIHYGVEIYDSAISSDREYEFLLGPAGLYAVKDPNIVTNPKANSVKTDFNGDGIADILWRNGSKNHLWLMHANGSHTYKNIGTKKKGYYLASTGDFNGDGITDILWRYKSTGTNHIWYMHADGSHTYKSIGKKNKSYYVAGTGDFNADGIDDILWRNGSKNHVWYMRANGTHRYKNIGGKLSWNSAIDIADFSGDGRDDILWVGDNTSHYIWTMQDDGTHGGNSNYWYDDYEASWEHAIHVLSRRTGDFNGDGIADVFTHEEYNSTILYTKIEPSHDCAEEDDDCTEPSEFVGDVTRYSGVAYNVPISPAYKLVTADDFNGDGISDILWRDDQGNNIIWMMQVNGNYISVDIGHKCISYTPSTWVAPSLAHNGTEIRALAEKDKNITNLDVSAVTNMNYAFRNLNTFNQPIGDWDVSNVESMKETFSGASSFNQPIGNWNVSSVKYTKFMFYSATRFNQPIGDWDVSSVRTMGSMFSEASSFNQPIGDWDVSNVKYMYRLFNGATNFNQPIGDWDVAHVINMNGMFYYAGNFNQNISNWDVSSVNSYSDFSYSSPLSEENKPNFK